MWVPAVFLVAVGCAKLVGLDGEYHVRGEDDDAPGGVANAGGDGGSTGGAPTGGMPTGGTESGGTGGDDVVGGSGGEPVGGSGGDGGSSGETPEGGTSGVSGSSGAMGGAGAGSGGSGGTSGSGGTAPSCGTGLSICGPNGTSNCCATHTVPSGSFYRGNDEAYEATLSTFALDIYETNVARMRAFVDANEKGYFPPVGSGKNPNNPEDPGWDSAWNDRLPADRAGFESAFRCEDPTQRTWTDESGEHERRPSNCVDFYMAYAFCIWDGGRLPTDAELNYAAAGGDEQRVYPWSFPPTSTYINESYASYFLLGAGPLACYGDGVYGCTVEDLVFVGTKSDGLGRWEHAELAGNVYEWVQDLDAPYPSECEDCANLTEGSLGVIRGGGFANNASLIQSDARLGWERAARSVAVGVRCARAP